MDQVLVFLLIASDYADFVSRGRDGKLLFFIHTVLKLTPSPPPPPQSHSLPKERVFSFLFLVWNFWSSEANSRLVVFLSCVGLLLRPTLHAESWISSILKVELEVFKFTPSSLPNSSQGFQVFGCWGSLSHMNQICALSALGPTCFRKW